MLAFLVLPVVSAYQLYYLSRDQVRAVSRDLSVTTELATSNIHAAAGFFPLLHIGHGKRLTMRASTAGPVPVAAQVTRRSVSS